MKKYGIVVSMKNREKIEALIDSIQSTRMKRVINYDDIVSACREIQDKYPIPLSNLEDCIFHIDLAAEIIPVSYSCKYGTPHSTQFTLLFHGRCWHLLEVVRDYMRSTDKEVHADLTDNAKESLIKAYTNFRVVI